MNERELHTMKFGMTLEMKSLDTGEDLHMSGLLPNNDITVFYSSENALSFINFQFKDAILSHKNK